METISAEGDGYVLALRFVQKGVVNLTHHTMTQPQNIGIRPSRRGNWGIGTQRLGHGKPVISVPPSQRAVRRRAWTNQMGQVRHHRHVHRVLSRKELQTAHPGIQRKPASSSNARNFATGTPRLEPPYSGRMAALLASALAVVAVDAARGR